MPDFQENIGATVTAFVPNDDRLISLGYTHVRFYFASSEGGSYSLASSEALSSGQRDYSYNKTDALVTDWWYWAPYGTTPGEGPQSEPQPVGPPQCTRKEIRQAVGRRLRLMETAQVTTGTDANTVICAGLIDADASAAKHANKYARSVAGNVSGETKRIRNISNSGYVPASGTLNFGQDFSATPNTSTELEIWRPVKDDDPGALIDEAINRVRRKVWWEEIFYLTAEANVTEYAAPSFMLPGSVTAVEYAANDYPSSPDWRPVGDWDLVTEGGQPVLSISETPFAAVSYSGGAVIRIRYNRYGDRLDADADYWNVALDWAAAEAALDFLRLVLTPGGGREDVSDAGVAIREVAQDVAEWRAVYMPHSRPQVRLPR